MKKTILKVNSMNFDKELKLTHSKSKAQWWAILVIFGIFLTFTACDTEDDFVVIEEYPSLKVENQLNDYWRSIYRVSLVGYEFYNINIEPDGDSQTFVLDEGMSGGYEDIFVKVSYIRYSGVRTSTSIKVNFKQGETTTIMLTGRSGCEGCPGIYLEQN